ncbi:MAG: hypothetical protein IJ086_15775 [Clostridium sp.]|nr:hypothetical protein [Clostridium sp.]MBQ9000133.1 hypothetical protein [Clostridium sp.]
MKSVYIVATYTGTTLSRIIRKVSDTPYSHISISLNKDLKPMYAFGRIHPRTPIFAGLVEENINEGLYAIKKNTMCRVYELEVNDDEYLLICNNLNYLWNKRKSLKYDAKSLVRLAINKPKLYEDRYVCSSFVSHVLESSGVSLFNKSYYEIQPIDFVKNNNNKLSIIYEGLLSKYEYLYNLKGAIINE